METAVGLLSRREHSELELSNKLRQKGFETLEIEAAVDRLLELDYLSNPRFAESFTRQRVGRGNGPVKIRYELRTRGIPDAMAEAVLEPYRERWIELACEVHQRKFGEVPKEFKERARQARFLQYKGFSTEHISAVLG
ncbi:MAG: regulatory protein RecX [bacterium]